MSRLIEPFAGLGSYSIRALWTAAGSRRDVRSEPPVSRVGSKSGFAPNVFRAFGLQRAKWDAVILNDLDPVCHLFHLLYASSELRDATAKRIWSFVPCPLCLPMDVESALAGVLKPTPEMCKVRIHVKADCPTCNGSGVQDARQLWERIRKEPVPGDVVEACSVALTLQTASFSNCAVTMWDGQHPWGMQRVDTISTVTFDDRRDGCKPAALASRLEHLPCGIASLADVTAKALFLQSRSFQLKPVSIVGGAWDEAGYAPEFNGRWADGSVTPQVPRWTVAERVEALPGRWVESGYKPESYIRSGETEAAPDLARWTVSSSLSLFPGPGTCQIGVSRMNALAFARGIEFGWEDVVIVDSPYLGKLSDKPTTGYAHTSSRDDVLAICEMAHRGGALVICHEAVGLSRELGRGWNERPASPLRSRGSTFWAEGEEKEFITFNRPLPLPWWPAQQEGLFG